MKEEDFLKDMPGAALRDIARNGSADPKYRKAAVVLLLRFGYKDVNHPDLVSLLAEVKEEQTAIGEVQDIVETAIEAPIQTPADELPDAPGPFRASFTTKSM